jgi:AcrR family transcriptional regulator
MRYTPEHKQRTRARIVAAAARLFRTRGFDGVGIDEIMAAAGLTRGGFYGYFRSKRALLTEVLGGNHDFNRRMAARAGRDRAALTDEALEIVAGYLDPANRERIGRGCHLVALSADVARADRATRAAYREKLEELVEEFGRGLADGRRHDPRALAAVALAVGGVLLARGVDDETFAAELAAACRASVQALLTTASPVRGRAR